MNINVCGKANRTEKWPGHGTQKTLQKFTLLPLPYCFFLFMFVTTASSSISTSHTDSARLGEARPGAGRERVGHGGQWGQPQPRASGTSVGAETPTVPGRPVGLQMLLSTLRVKSNFHEFSAWSSRVRSFVRSCPTELQPIPLVRAGVLGQWFSGLGQRMH